MFFTSKIFRDKKIGSEALLQNDYKKTYKYTFPYLDVRFGPKITLTEKYISGPFGPAGADPGGGGLFFFFLDFLLGYMYTH